MAQNDNIQLFEDKRIRTAWDEDCLLYTSDAADDAFRV